MCRRGFVFPKRGSACSEIPEDAASEMMAIIFCPVRNAFFSEMFTWSCVTPAPARGSHRCPPRSSGTKRILRPVISDTCSTPKCEMIRSSAFDGSFRLASIVLSSSRLAIASGISSPSTSSLLGRRPSSVALALVVGRCFINMSLAISFGVETSLSSSRPTRLARSAASLALASPVESRPMTTQWPLASATLASSIANLALIELRSCLKKDWWAPQ
mmetsp:Transcript_13031/g.27750  ORF Transcript_13031/g.27750 Transcript_13031/m.27750 type:complete len:216 (+) Transcript_13031:256-903(+)